MNLLEIIKKRLPAPGDFEECYAFSIHKAGSTLMYMMIADVCNAAKIPAISIPDILFSEGIKDNQWENDINLLDLITLGRIYYGFRYLPEILQHQTSKLRGKQCVLLIRDPRDALVSEYYSYGGKHFSHHLPNKNKEAFIEIFSNSVNLDIDQYVLRFANNHLNKLNNYKQFLDFDHVLLRKYEDIYFNKKAFINDIFSHFRIQISSSIIDQVATKHDIRPTQEDPTKHIRKGTPGDHRLKLQQDTISKLNDIFRETCRWYGYNLD